MSTVDHPHLPDIADFIAWEQKQADRFEWIEGTVVRCAGGSFEHAAIISNLNAALHAATLRGPCIVQGSDRRLVPRNRHGDALGSFYADLFVSCSAEDRQGVAAHFPTIVIEVLSRHVGEEFTRKKEAYLASERIRDYVIIDSTRRYAFRYSWHQAGDARRLVAAEYRRGPVPFPTLGLTIAFDQIYAGTNVPAILHPLRELGEEDAEILLD